MYSCFKWLLKWIHGLHSNSLLFLGWLISTMHFNYKAMPTQDTDYSCHIKHMGWISCQITPLVINSLWIGHTQMCTHACTHPHTHTHTHTHIHTHKHTHIHKHTHTHTYRCQHRNNFKKQSMWWPMDGVHLVWKYINKDRHWSWLSTLILSLYSYIDVEVW